MDVSVFMTALISGLASGMASMLVFVGTVKTDLVWLKRVGDHTSKQVESLPCMKAACPFKEEN